MPCIAKEPSISLANLLKVSTENDYYNNLYKNAPAIFTNQKQLSHEVLESSCSENVSKIKTPEDTFKAPEKVFVFSKVIIGFKRKLYKKLNSSVYIFECCVYL